MAHRTVSKGRAQFLVSVGERADHDAFWDWFASPEWEPDTVAVYRALVGPGVCVADIGAWIGPTTLLAAAEGARVVAVEPDPVAAEVLERNLALNPDLAERVRVLRIAIGDRDGEATLVSASGPGDSLSHLDRGQAVATKWRAPMLSLGSFLRLPEASGVRFVKLDAEGAEYAAVPAMRDFIEEQRPSVYVATHPNLLYDRTTPWTRVRSGLAALRANRRMLQALASYRHHYVVVDGRFRDVRRRNRLRSLVPLPLRASLLIGSCLFTDELLTA